MLCSNCCKRHNRQVKCWRDQVATVNHVINATTQTSFTIYLLIAAVAKFKHRKTDIRWHGTVEPKHHIVFLSQHHQQQQQQQQHIYTHNYTYNSDAHKPNGIYTRAVPNIHFVSASAPNSGPNSLFVFGRAETLDRVQIVVMCQPQSSCCVRLKMLYWLTTGKNMSTVLEVIDFNIVF